ncbi:putative Phosphatase [Leptomonas pyrrhocoris]|uniref:Putative Phosphatase n=1 Tax=Leptomonas pyrrhocoris TaxID=157538 RepID=A0A0M9G8C5_LEPPY|nr:putative Phosphatase [Leptomonas pyrrhocoris]XP_015663006.1 putative Phosphatase [Leptomonas pyrrhocoris]KPA84566.1 putative Phosphatase [Leptomonas pyrrhocoris]KPA84567.1 putative Phosphatase [Leptomonas pyrrhocoris]|eukprot:XP_015663005.1 putative Phosphatase [Leptomonas pyrrhocoris]
MLADVSDNFARPPPERLTRSGAATYTKKKSRHTKLRRVDESEQDDWLDRARQGVHCSLLCGGTKCRHESWEAMTEEAQRAAAIEGLNSNWVGDDVIASQRPSTSLFVKYPIIAQFSAKHVTGVLNLQEKGEHSNCGPEGVYESSGYSYNGAEDLMPHGISYYEFPWPDMTAPEQEVVLRSVQVMDFHIKQKGKVLVHCHAGLGRTGLLIACYYVYSKHIPSSEAIALVRKARPGAIQTTRQGQFIAGFENHLWRLSQAFRVEISDALIDLDLFIQRQRLVLHGEQADLYKNVPLFLHNILCRLLNLTKDNPEASRLALLSLGPSAAPSDAVLSSCRIAINRRRFRVQSVRDVSILSFLVCDWFRSSSSPALTVESCDKMVEYKRGLFAKPEGLSLEIRKILSKPTRHTLGMVTSAVYIISRQVEGTSLTTFAFRCLVDALNHAFNAIKVRHSPLERELLHEFFLEWGASVGDMYFNYDAVPAAHRTIKRIALASSIVLQATKAGDVRPYSPKRTLLRPVLSATAEEPHNPTLRVTTASPVRRKSSGSAAASPVSPISTTAASPLLNYADSANKTRLWREHLVAYRRDLDVGDRRRRGGGGEESPLSPVRNNAM